MMLKAVPVRKARGTKNKKAPVRGGHEGFNPCSQDMTICGDCERNRAQQKCPRLKEWLAKKES